MRLRLVNVGLIRDASIDLSSFSIVMGQNNSGKSTLATALYAATKSVNGLRGRHGAMQVSFGSPIGGGVRPDYMSSQNLDILLRDLRQKMTDAKMAEITARLTNRIAQSILTAYANLFVAELERGLGAELGEIATRDRSGRRLPLRLQVTSSRPDWTIDAWVRGDSVEVSVTIGEEDFSEFIPPTFLSRMYIADSGEPLSEQDARYISSFLGQEVGSLLFSEFPPAAHYLPAARAGLLQSHRLVAAAMFQRTPMVGLDEMSMPALSGVVADFVSEILLRGPSAGRERTQITRFADEIESIVLGGRLDQVPTPLGYPEIEFENYLGKFPIQRTSSMISELAPIVLLLRTSVRPGDLLIIEEPESHLHPHTQTSLARILFNLARHVRVFITTHSDFFVTQLNNEIRGRQIKAGYDDAPGFTSAYWVHQLPEGSRVKTLHVDPVDGIPEDSFEDVARELYDLQVEQQVMLADSE